MIRRSKVGSAFWVGNLSSVITLLYLKRNIPAQQPMRPYQYINRSFFCSRDYVSRLPARLKSTFRKKVWELAGNSAGVRLRFITDSNTVEGNWYIGEYSGQSVILGDSDYNLVKNNNFSIISTTCCNNQVVVVSGTSASNNITNNTIKVSGKILELIRMDS